TKGCKPEGVEGHDGRLTDRAYAAAHKVVDHKWNSTLTARRRQLQALVRRRPRGQMPQIGTDPTPPCLSVVLGGLPRLGDAVGRRTWARASAHHARTPESLEVGGSRPRRRLPFPRA